MTCPDCGIRLHDPEMVAHREWHDKQKRVHARTRKTVGGCRRVIIVPTMKEAISLREGANRARKAAKKK